MKKILAICLLVLVSACTTDQGTYTLLSNKIVNVKDFDVSNNTKVKHVKGEDVSHIILFWPTKSNPNISAALTDALNKADADVMTDVTAKTFGWWFLYGQTGWTVEGDAVKTRNR